MMQQRTNNFAETLLKVFFLNLFLLPIYPDNIKPSVVAVFLLASIFFFIKNKGRKRLSKELIRVFFINSAIFLVLTFSLLFSEDKGHGAEYLLRISPMLLFPMAFMLVRTNKEVYREPVFLIGKLLFYCSTLVFFITIFLIFYWRGNVTENFILNYSHRIIFELGRYSIHPIYASLYIGIAIVFSISLFKNSKYKVLVVLGNALLLFNLILLSRKSMIIILVILCVVYFIYEKRILLKWKLLSLFSLVMIILFVVKFVPEVSNRFKDIKSLIENKDEFSSSNLRVNIYKTAFTVIKKEPVFGHGVGDSKMVLELEENKQTFFRGKNYNSHNQFLGYTISTGIFGLVIFLMFLGFNFRTAVTSSNFEHMALLSIFVFLMFVENILDRQNGVILFSFYVNYAMFRNVLSKKE